MLIWPRAIASNWLKLVNFSLAAMLRMLQSACFVFFFLDTSYCNGKYRLPLPWNRLMGFRMPGVHGKRPNLKGTCSQARSVGF